jgi:hypothetical protein
VPDFGRELRFGYFLVPNAADPVVSMAREAERRRFDYVAIQDHPYQRRYLDTWLTDLAVRIGFDTFVIWAEGDDHMPLFADEVVPALRARVAAERAGPRG